MPNVKRTTDWVRQDVLASLPRQFSKNMMWILPALKVCNALKVPMVQITWIVPQSRLRSALAGSKLMTTHTVTAAPRGQTNTTTIA
jgi:hypothetical protein